VTVNGKPLPSHEINSALRMASRSGQSYNIGFGKLTIVQLCTEITELLYANYIKLLEILPPKDDTTRAELELFNTGFNEFRARTEHSDEWTVFIDSVIERHPNSMWKELISLDEEFANLGPNDRLHAREVLGACFERSGMIKNLRTELQGVLMISWSLRQRTIFDEQLQSKLRESELNLDQERAQNSKLVAKLGPLILDNNDLRKKIKESEDAKRRLRKLLRNLPNVSNGNFAEGVADTHLRKHEKLVKKLLAWADGGRRRLGSNSPTLTTFLVFFMLFLGTVVFLLIWRRKQSNQLATAVKLHEPEPQSLCEA